MKTKFILLIFLLGQLSAVSCQIKRQVLDQLDANSNSYQSIAKEIWSLAELGYQEYESSRLLKELLSEEGFTIESGVANIPTAFVASYGNGPPVIGILAEYDALPGMSQDTIAERIENPYSKNGHACGHHLFGTASSAAAIAIKQWLNQSNHKGTVRLYGTPAEEGGAGKVYMVRAGLFDEVDAVLHWHPGDQNSASTSSSLANKSAKFRFYGTASHAAIAPQNGRSALDGVEAMNYMVNLMREHVQSDTRIHYVITKGGEAPNIVPDFAEVYYYVRHPEMDIADKTFERVRLAAEAAALGTETRMDYEIIHGVYNLLPNESLSRVIDKNINEIGGFNYSPEEKIFAKKLMETFPNTMNRDINNTSKISRFRIVERCGGGSTDVGDISWVVPTASLVTATWVPGTIAHTWQAVAAGGMSIGHKGMMLAAKTIASSAIDLFQNEHLLTQAKKELIRRRGTDFKYQALLGDREPPLDYRK